MTSISQRRAPAMGLRPANSAAAGIGRSRILYLAF
jgi:hypothetical protein